MRYSSSVLLISVMMFFSSRSVALSPSPAYQRSKCSSTLGVILQSPLTTNDLPDERPPPWHYCGSKCALDKSLDMLPNGGMVIQVVHKPIKGVTPEMITWWFNGNVDGYMTHPINGKNYSRYLVWHPRDHIEQRTVTPGPAPGNATRALWSIVEFFQSKDHRGYVKGDNPCHWSDQFFTNVKLRVQKLDLGGLTLAFEVQGQKPMRLTHGWSSSPEGLRLTSTMYVGFSSNNAVAAAANRIAKRAFGGTQPERAGRIWQEHCLEEMNNLKYFLPQLYAQENGGGASYERIPEPEAQATTSRPKTT